MLHLFSLDQRKEFSSHSLTTSSSAAIHTQLLVVNYKKLILDKRLIGNWAFANHAASCLHIKITRDPFTKKTLGLVNRQTDTFFTFLQLLKWWKHASIIRYLHRSVRTLCSSQPKFFFRNHASNSTVKLPATHPAWRPIFSQFES